MVMDERLIIKNVKIYTMSDIGVIDKGYVIVENGKIKSVGRGDVKLGSNDEIIDGEGQILLPGLIDAHSHVGFQRLEWIPEESLVEVSDPLTPHYSVLDNFDPYDPAFKDAIMGGVTTVAVLPGSHMSFLVGENINIIPGRLAIIKTNGKVLVENAGLKIAVGEHPKRFLSSNKMIPTTRMGIFASIRSILVKTMEYMDRKEKGEKIPIDLKLEALADVLKGKIPVRIHVHTVRDIINIIRVLEDFNVRRIVLDHATESYIVADMLKEKHIPVVLGPIVFSRRGVELKNLSSKIPVKLYEKGVLFSLTTDHPTIPIQYLTLLAGVAVGEGLPYMEALKAITINPAKILGLDNDIGSIEPGKEADLALFSDDPLDPTSKVSLTIINGEVVYRR